MENYSYHNKCAHCYRTFNNLRRPIECTNCHAMVCEKCSVVNKVDHQGSNSGNNNNADVSTYVNECLVCNRKRSSKEIHYNKFTENSNKTKKRKEHKKILKFTPRLEYKEINDADNNSVTESNELNSANFNNSDDKCDNIVTQHQQEEEEMPSLPEDKERLLLEVALKTRELSAIKEKMLERESKCEILQNEINEQYEVIRQLGERLESVIDSNETLRRELWSRAPQSRKQQEHTKYKKTTSSSPVAKGKETITAIQDVNEESQECNTSHSANTIVLEKNLHITACELDIIQTQFAQNNYHSSIVRPLITQIKPFTLMSPLPEAASFSSYCYDMKSCAELLLSSGALLLPSIAHHIAREWNLFTSPEEYLKEKEELQKTRETWQTRENEQRWVNYAALIEANYRHDNPHHNEIHAADVIHSVVALLTSTPSLLKQMSAMEKLCMVFAAMVHDVRHPGRSSQFLCKTHDFLYLHYNGLHVLEQMHIASSFELLRPNCHEFHVDEPIQEFNSSDINKEFLKKSHLKELNVNFTEGMTDDEFETFHDLASYCILHTDMYCHQTDVQQWLERISKQNDSGTLHVDFTNALHRKEVLSLFLHAADVGVQSKGLTIARKWLGIIDEMNAEQKELAALQENKFVAAAETKKCNMKGEEECTTDDLVNDSISSKVNNEEVTSAIITERDMSFIAPGQIQFLSNCVVPLFYIIHHISSELTQPLQNLHQVILYYSQFVQGPVKCASFPQLPRRHTTVQTNETYSTTQETPHYEEEEEEEPLEKLIIITEEETKSIRNTQVLELLKEYAENKESSEIEKRLARVTVAMSLRERELELFVQQLDKTKRLVERRERRNWQMSEYLWQIARKLLHVELYDEASLRTAYNSLELLHNNDSYNINNDNNIKMKDELQVQGKQKHKQLYDDTSSSISMTNNKTIMNESNLVNSQMYNTLKQTQKRLHNAMSDMM